MDYRRMTVCLLLVVAMAASAWAEDRGNGEASVKQGKILVSGESRMLLGVTRGSYDGGNFVENGTGFDLAARGGYFVIDGLVVGGKLRFGWDTTRQDYARDFNRTVNVFTFELLPGVRYYFLHDKWFKPFVGGELGLKYVMTDAKDLTTGTALFGLDVGGGIALFLVDQVSIDLGMNIGYYAGSLRFKPAGVGSTTYNGGELDFNLGAAISAYF